MKIQRNCIYIGIVGVAALSLIAYHFCSVSKSKTKLQPIVPAQRTPVASSRNFSAMQSFRIPEIKTFVDGMIEMHIQGDISERAVDGLIRLQKLRIEEASNRVREEKLKTKQSREAEMNEQSHIKAENEAKLRAFKIVQDLKKEGLLTDNQYLIDSRLQDIIITMAQKNPIHEDDMESVKAYLKSIQVDKMRSQQQCHQHNSDEDDIIDSSFFVQSATESAFGDLDSMELTSNSEDDSE